jgi:glutaredoxin
VLNDRRIGWHCWCDTVFHTQIARNRDARSQRDPLINRVRPDVPVILIPDINHMGMVTDPRALAAVASAVK